MLILTILFSIGSQDFKESMNNINYFPHDLQEYYDKLVTQPRRIRHESTVSVTWFFVSFESISLDETTKLW